MHEYILVDIIVVSVVTPKSNLSTKSQPVGEKDLSGCFNPHLGYKKTTIDLYRYIVDEFYETCDSVTFYF